MTEDTQCETMGIQATSPPTSPLLRVSPVLKRKYESGCTLDIGDSTDLSEAKKLCIEIVYNAAQKQEVEAQHELNKEENKENEISVKDVPTTVNATVSKASPVSPALQSTSSVVTPIATCSTSTSQASHKAQTDSEPKESLNPKVIVEHQPLPSIYDLRQMTSCEDMYEDSGLSEDDSSGEETSSEDEDDVRPSPIFEPVLRGTGNLKPVVVTPTPPTPKAIYGSDRFWSQNSFSAPSPQPMGPSATPVSMSGNTTYQFLENSNQRIECAENGKSYLQLGTMSHHLPVTPVIQPKPNMVYRRPVSPFRSPMLPVQPTRPVCDHSNCLIKKSSLCYKGLRSRMMNLSLHKLHMARQNHEGSLRRSVLICNMLRYIEDESEKESAQEFVSPPQHPIPPPVTMMENEHYWPPSTSSGMVSLGSTNEEVQQQYLGSHNGIISPYGVVSNCNVNGAQCGLTSNTTVQGGSITDTYENTLKDFNSAFRSTPYSSPAHPGTEADSGLGSGEEDRGINWGSVLSLSSQSELDPLNNNSFANETWPSSNSVAGSSSAVDTLDISSTTTGFEDLGWKLSASDVLKAFPGEEGLFSIVSKSPA